MSKDLPISSLPKLSKDMPANISKTSILPSPTKISVKLPPISSLPPLKKSSPTKTTSEKEKSTILPPVSLKKLPPISLKKPLEISKTEIPIPSLKSEKNEPLLPLKSIPLPSLKSEKNEPLLPLKSEKNEPLLPLKSEKNEPLLPLKSIPLPSLKSEKNEPLLPLKSEKNEPLLPLKSEKNEPLLPLKSPEISKIPKSPISTSLKSLPPLSSIKKLAPLKTTMSKSEVKTPIFVKSPLAKEIKEKREEIISQIEEEVIEKTKLQFPEKTQEIIGISEDIKSLMKPLKPLQNSNVFVLKEEKNKSISSLPPLPELPKLAPNKDSALQIAKEGVLKSNLIEPEAAFQNKTKYAKTPLIEGIKEQISLATIASPANLPGKRSNEPTPKIKIPKINDLVKPSPTYAKKTKISGITLPTTTTVIEPIPITSPAAINIPKVSIAKSESEDVMKNILKIEVSKLKSDHVRKGEETYSVNELKAIAGSINISKSGGKKELVERIKNVILKTNPSAFENIKM